MLGRTPKALAVATLVAAAGPPAAAQAASAPPVLPAVTKALSAPAGGCTTTSYRAPMSGYLDVRLRGTGDWDLVVDKGSTRSASKAFGGRELLQTWVRTGDRLVARGCRAEGASRTARLTFRLVDIKPPSLTGKVQLVDVKGTREKLQALEAKGLDMTHEAHSGHAEFVVSGVRQMAALRASGLPFEVEVPDLVAFDRRQFALDRRYAARVGESKLPSGRTTYRTLPVIQDELKQLVADHPTKVRKVVFGTSFQGREINGVEIAQDVQADDGRPTFFLMGVHHAREWPSAEMAMEFAHLLAKGGGDARLAKLLRTTRVVILPVVNPDGYDYSRGAFSVADTIGPENDPGEQSLGLGLYTAEVVGPPGGIGAYRRKNCNGEIGGPSVPCMLAWGVDNNRNYGNLWGGPGSSSDVTSQSYHGPGPRSEPETQAVWNYARTHNVTNLVSLHTVAALVLRPPGVAGAGLAPDEERMKAIGDSVAKAAGYTSQYGWQLYDTTGTTEDDTYAATGGYGYTIEIGPPDGFFHSAYETGVVAEWTGENPHAKGAGGLREGLIQMAEAAGSTPDHAVLDGRAPAGRVLRVKKSFKTRTSPFCEKGIEPVVTVGPAGGVCLTGQKDPIDIDDTVEITTKVPAGGQFEWHLNQSTRPFVGGGAVKEELKTLDPPVASFSGAPDAPSSTTDHEVVLPADQPTDKLLFDLTADLPEDYDIEVFLKQADGSLKSVGASGNVPGSPESVVLDKPAPGTYVTRVTYYAALTGGYDLVVRRAVATRTVTQGTKESYTLTCETTDGKVLSTTPLTIDRGQRLRASLGCGTGETVIVPAPASGSGAGTPVAAPKQTAAQKRAAAKRKAAAKKRAAAKARAKKLRACQSKARKVKSRSKRARALKACSKRYGTTKKKAPARKKA